MTDKDPIVGHKTYRDADGSYRHEPLRQSESEALWNRIEANKAKRALDMPTEQDAIRAMFEAWQRLTELGWRRGSYMPTTGERFAAVEVGSTGIHACTAQRADDFKTTWTTYDGDVWPSSHPPALFRPWRETDVQPNRGPCCAVPEETTPGVATRHPRCGYPYCACVGQCFAASQPGAAAGVEGTKE